MGDRTWISIQIAKKDIKKFLKADPDLAGYNEIENNDGIITLFFYEMNYAWYDGAESCAGRGLTFCADHGSGGSYGSGSYACFKGELVDIETNHDGWPCVPYNEDGPLLYILGNVKKYLKIYGKVKQYFKDYQDNDKTATQPVDLKNLFIM